MRARNHESERPNAVLEFAVDCVTPAIVAHRPITRKHAFGADDSPRRPLLSAAWLRLPWPPTTDIYSTPPPMKKLHVAELSALIFAAVPGHAQTPRSNSGAANDMPPIVLSEFEVRSSVDDGYKAANALSGTRFNTKLIDLPKAVEVMTSEFLNDIGAVEIADALAYSSSIAQTGSPGADDITGVNFTVRGYSTFTTYRNGYRYFGIIDPVMIDRIELIKGPSSVFSGPIEPGGTISTITKKPAMKQSGSAKLRFGTYRRVRGEVVYNTPSNRKKNMGLRLAGVFEEGDSYQDFAGKKRYVLGATYLWNPTPRTSFLLDTQFVDQLQRPAAPIPYFNSTIVNPAIVGLEPNVRREFNRQGPDARSDLQQFQSTADVTYTLSDRWSFRIGNYYRYQSLTRLRALGSTRITTNAATGVRTAQRQATWEPNADSFVLSPQAYILGRFDYGEIVHRVIAGVEYYYDNQRNDVLINNSLPRIDIDRPQPADYSFGNLSTYTRSDIRRVIEAMTGSSVTNVLSFYDDRVTALQGLRYSTVDREQKNLANGGRSQLKTDALTPSYGLTVQLLKNVKAFVSYSESFVPQTNQTPPTFDGMLLDPIEGAGWDYGIKFDIREGRLSGSIIGFDITQKNTAQADPDHPGFSINTGTSESKGVEFSLIARPISTWQVVAAFANTDARITKDRNVLLDGLRQPNVPERQWSLWNRYRFERTPLKGFAIGLGLIHVGERRGSPGAADLPGVRLPKYTRIDGNVSYDTNLFGRKANLGVFVSNATDEDYLTSYFGYGEPLTVTGSISFRF